MKKGLYVLAAVACLLLSACSKEGIDSVAGQSAGATREVKMSLGAGIQLFGRDEISGGWWLQSLRGTKVIV